MLSNRLHDVHHLWSKDPSTRILNTKEVPVEEKRGQRQRQSSAKSGIRESMQDGRIVVDDGHGREREIEVVARPLTRSKAQESMTSKNVSRASTDVAEGKLAILLHLFQATQVWLDTTHGPLFLYDTSGSCLLRGFTL